MIRITDGRYIRNIYGIPVIVDIFRSSSTIVTMLMKGIEEIVPIRTVNEAFTLKKQGYLLFGEEDTEKINGFDYGNSPHEISKLDLEKNKAVLKTTNGTEIILKAGDGALIGSFLNITALSKYLRNREVHLFPANTPKGVATEDNEFSYALSKRILEPAADIKTNIQRARNGNGSLRLKEHNLSDDIESCLQLDVTDIIPIFREGKIVRLQ